MNSELQAASSNATSRRFIAPLPLTGDLRRILTLVRFQAEPEAFDRFAILLATRRFDVITLYRYDASPEGGPMSDETSKRATVYFDPALHKAVRLKAAHTHRSVSDIVNDAVRLALREDQEDLAAFEDRVAEPVISYEALLKDLKAHGKL